MSALVMATERRWLDADEFRGTIAASKFDVRSRASSCSGWSSLTTKRVALGQVPTDDRPNEIAAIPTLLNVPGAVATIDARGG